MKAAGRLALIAAALLAAAFAFQNRGERVAVDLGPLHVYAVSLPAVVFTAFLLGMTAMLLLSLPADRRTRDLLRAHGPLDAPVPASPPSPLPAPSPALPADPEPSPSPDATPHHPTTPG